MIFPQCFQFRSGLSCPLSCLCWRHHGAALLCWGLRRVSLSASDISPWKRSHTLAKQAVSCGSQTQNTLLWAERFCLHDTVLLWVQSVRKSSWLCLLASPYKMSYMKPMCWAGVCLVVYEGLLQGRRWWFEVFVFFNGALALLQDYSFTHVKAQACVIIIKVISCKRNPDTKLIELSIR